MSSEKLNKTIFKRTLAFNRLKEINQFAQKCAADPLLKSDFLVRYESLEQTYNDFQTHHLAVISLLTNDSDFEEHDKVRLAADNIYYAIKGVFINLRQEDSSTAALSSPSDVRTKSVKLPKISLPSFDGNFKDWPTFFDLFNALIHDNHQLGNVEKFQYLVTSLSKEPLALVKSLPLTDTNYSIAYNIIKNRYQNKRYLATCHYHEMMSAPAIVKTASQDIRKLLNTFTENVKALKTLGFPVDHWDFLLFNILLNKLDNNTKTEFEKSHSTIELPTYSQLTMFIDNQCKALETVQLGSNFGSVKPPSHIPRKASALLTTTDSTRSSKCLLCPSMHPLYRCSSFLGKTPVERFALMKKHNFCLNCLRPNHNIKTCPSEVTCKVCHAQHHTLLHMNKKGIIVERLNTTTESPVNPHPVKLNSLPNPASTPSTSQTLSTLINTSHHPLTVLLSTVEVCIKDIRGNYQTIRALLDSGSMSNFISEACVNRLGLSRKSSHFTLEGVNDLTTDCYLGMTYCQIKPRHCDEPQFKFDALILPKVCSEQPKIRLDFDQWPHLQNLKFSDRKCHLPGPIDLLIGAELVPYILGRNRIFGDADQPVAVETVFGWTLQGKVVNSANYGILTNYHVSVEPALDLVLQKFWQLENVPQPPLLSPDEQKCENIYKNTVSREPTGRFIVQLPFKHETVELGDSRAQALRRFTLLELRILRQPKLYEEYSNFMKDYLDCHHMSLVPFQETIVKNPYYIPHHCVIKPESVSTKLRVVFDASAKTTNGKSLNDLLFIGPKLQKDIPTVLLNFRSFPIVFVCDIKQMYRQISIDPKHRDYQRILWRFSPDDPVQEYRLNTVTYGISSSPFLALRTLNELADAERHTFPRAAMVLQHSIYVDDIITGDSSLESALQLQSELIGLLKSGGFELRKWASNHPQLLVSVEKSSTQMPFNFDKEDPIYVKVLGLQWNPNLDIFFYSFTPTKRSCTKRNILSDIARIFDPIGFIVPVIMFAKHFMQKLWIANLGWDEEPSQPLRHEWETFKSELPILANFRIPRRILSDHICHVSLHGFCDASEVGFAAVVFLAVEQFSGHVNPILLCAKSRVAPLKTITIPRLELCAALLLANLIAYIKTVLSKPIHFDDIFAWSDSMVTLDWIRSSPHKWKTFVANRVSQIHNLVGHKNWYYVSTDENPADCASRGCMPSSLQNHQLWWRGPNWLSQSREYWPPQPGSHSNLSRNEELRNVLVVANVVPNFFESILNKYSSLNRVLRVLAYCKRFMINSKPSSPRKREHLTSVETDEILNMLVKYVQSDCFSDIIHKLKSNKPLPKPYRRLAPFLDDRGFIRVGGRLKNSSLALDAKHPLLLPSRHRLVKLIIEQVHRDNCHPGFRTLHYLLLQKFWILSPRRAIEACLSSCIRCFRVKPKSSTPFMGDLPASRVSQLKPFLHVCVDYAGPFTITMNRVRGAKTIKAYICIFVCCSTKAIHIELASDLSSDAFIAAFRRFTSRRGKCSTLFSDQGTNFIGAFRQFLKFSQIAAERLEINWHFNPPSAPHFNGLAEAGVKAVKTHLFRVIGQQILTYEELYTVLTQIEAVLNSRPLCATSADPNDLLPLTPAHFLVLAPLNSSIPELNYNTINVNRLTRWQLVQRMVADFWSRWSTEYLHTLQQRGKWNKHADNIKLNTLVLIRDEQKTPFAWVLGRITNLHPGKDGVVRVATVQTTHGSLDRAIVKLCPLPNQ